MRQLKNVSTAVICLVALTAPMFAVAQDIKVPVQVTHSGEDSVGRQFAYELREGIRSSYGFRLVDDVATSRVVLSIVSLDLSNNGKGISSAIAVATTFDAIDVPVSGYHITTAVQHCGTDKTAQCARRAMANLDEDLQYLKNKWPAVWRKLGASNVGNARQ